MKRRDYLAGLLRQRPEWLRSSMAEPTRYMTRTHVLLHAVALRRMGALGSTAKVSGYERSEASGSTDGLERRR